jgi:hypothetical protein
VTRLLYFKSTAGTFHVARDETKRYHILFNGESMGIYQDMVEAIESFVNESGFYIVHPEMGYPLDTFDLGIPDDIGGWKPC